MLYISAQNWSFQGPRTPAASLRQFEISEERPIFGALPITPEEIVKQVQALAKQLRPGTSFRERTSAISGLLHKLGEEREHKLCYKKLPGFPEFLLDCSWVGEANGSHEYSRALPQSCGSLN